MKARPLGHRTFTPLLLMLAVAVALNPVLLALPGGWPAFDLVMIGVLGSAVYAISGTGASSSSASSWAFRRR